MGFYFRKSIRVGPLRFNLSKSGVGISAGVRGFRVGTGPRGNYVHMGAGGIYYRSTLPSARHSTGRQNVREPIAQANSKMPMEAIASGDIAEMIDSASEDLLSELEEKRKRIQLFPLAAGLTALITIVLVVLDAPIWFLVPMITASLIATTCFYQHDVLSKTTVILYDLDATMERAYERVHESMDAIAQCVGIWHIDARGQVYDPKYHGGAGQIVRRNRIQVSTSLPRFLKANIEIPVIPFGARRLCFFPERLLVFASDGVGAVSYDDLSIVIQEKRFIEDGSAPRDAQVVDHTWQIVNKAGGPDRRFKNNVQLPVCLYEELWFNSPNGLNEVMQLSRVGPGRALDAALQNLADLVAKAAEAPAQRISSVGQVPIQRSTRPHDAESATQSRRSLRARVEERRFDDWHVSLVELLCCLMVADGRASSAEKKRIRELMLTEGPDWTNSKVDDHIDAFIDRVHRDGYRRMLASALQGIELLKNAGKGKLALQCLDAVAAADDRIGQREIQLRERIRLLLE